MITKRAAEVASALGWIYECDPLTWPRFRQVDRGREFMGVITQLLAKHGVHLTRVQAGDHRQQGIVECFNQTLRESLFGTQYVRKLLLAARKSSERSASSQLLEVVAALNEEPTHLLGVQGMDPV